MDSFYFCSVAVTTVGFGDLTPSTDASKLFTVFYVFSGVTLIATWLNVRLKKRAVKVAHRARTLPLLHADRPVPPGDDPDDPGSTASGT